MKKESTFGYILRLSLTLLIITGVMALLLGSVNALTEDRIAQINAQKARDALAAVLPDAASAQERTGFSDPTGQISQIYESESGYAIQLTVAGFGGDVDMMVGVAKTGEVLGVSIISHTETAGLGAVAAAKTSNGQAFRDQFVGMSGTLAVTKDGGQVDAISSATITSRAVTEGVNIALAWVAQNG